MEFDHLNNAQDLTTVIPPEIASRARPILGWIGVVDERVGNDLLGQVALHPDWSFVIARPFLKVDPDQFPCVPNYCAAFDIYMVCLALNASTEFINPIKVLEYMATGRPIVSTRVRDVVQQWSDVVYLSNDAEEFILQVER